MTSDTVISPSDEVDRRGHKPRERKCIATGETADPNALIRFALSPNGVVTPDIAAKLPGRGVWLTPEKTVLEKAIKTNAFVRGFKRAVNIPDNLADIVAELLSQNVINMIGMAKKSGQLLLGFDQVHKAASQTALAIRIEARNGSPDGRGKIRTLSKAVNRELGMPLPIVIGCFDSHVLGNACGRDNIVHAAIKPGKFASNLSDLTGKLSGFQSLIPDDWPDREHEQK